MSTDHPINKHVFTRENLKGKIYLSYIGFKCSMLSHTLFPFIWRIVEKI